MKLRPDNSSYHLKYICDILTGYFCQSLMKSLLQHIWKRLHKRLNALGTQEVSFTRPTSTVPPSTSRAGSPARSATLLTGRPRAAHTQKSQEVLSSSPTAGQGPRAAQKDCLTCTYICGVLYYIYYSKVHVVLGRHIWYVLVLKSGVYCGYSKPSYSK